jgi:RNA polymerase sigma-70 factor (ECF subfamily)
VTPRGKAPEAEPGPAFTALVRDHLDVVFGLVLRRVGDRQLAEDLVQEAFLRAWRARASLRDPERARGWLCVIAANVVRDHVRARAARPAEVFDLGQAGHLAAGDDPAEAVAATETARALIEVLARLPAQHREMFVLRERDGLSYREIAAVMDCPIGSVMSGLARARERLLEVLR